MFALPNKSAGIIQGDWNSGQEKRGRASVEPWSGAKPRTTRANTIATPGRTDQMPYSLKKIEKLSRFGTQNGAGPFTAFNKLAKLLTYLSLILPTALLKIASSSYPRDLKICAQQD
jgi:hypothetical protein